MLMGVYYFYSQPTHSLLPNELCVVDTTHFLRSEGRKRRRGGSLREGTHVLERREYRGRSEVDLPPAAAVAAVVLLLAEHVVYAAQLRVTAAAKHDDHELALERGHPMCLGLGAGCVRPALAAAVPCPATEPPWPVDGVTGGRRRSEGANRRGLAAQVRVVFGREAGGEGVTQRRP